MAYLIGVIVSTRVLRRSLPDLHLTAAGPVGRPAAARRSRPGHGGRRRLVLGGREHRPDGQLGRALALAGRRRDRGRRLPRPVRALLHVAEVADIVRTVLARRRRGSAGHSAADQTADLTIVPRRFQPRPGRMPRLASEKQHPRADRRERGPDDQRPTRRGHSDRRWTPGPDPGRPRDAARPRSAPDGSSWRASQPRPSTPAPCWPTATASRSCWPRRRRPSPGGRSTWCCPGRCCSTCCRRTTRTRWTCSTWPGRQPSPPTPASCGCWTRSTATPTRSAATSSASTPTGQSLEVLLSHGPLSGLEAAWVVREVADALSGVHSLGLYHQRINPDTVVLTPDGHVKIVGLLIEEALRPAPGSALLGRDPAADRPPRSRSTWPIWAGCCTPAWCPAGPAARRSACRPLRDRPIGTGSARDRSGPACPPRWTTSATRSSVTRRGAAPRGCAPPTTSSTH